MTQTELKLRDAATQMELALQHTDNEDVLRSCINSFISHARSVTFVMQKESSGHPELKRWYDAQVPGLKQSQLLRFFNDRRVHVIHQGVVRPVKDVGEALDVQVNGVSLPGPHTFTFWRFERVDDFIHGDNGGVFRLCEQYYLILRKLVGDWLRARAELGIS